MKKIYFIIALSIFSNICKAQSEPFIGQISYVAFNFAPKGWAECKGQLLSIAQNQALFSLLGTDYGGDGMTTFALPNMQGRVLLGEGTDNMGQSYVRGQIAGVEQVNLTVTQMPAHNHMVQASTKNGDSNEPTNNYFADTKTLDKEYTTLSSDVSMNQESLSPTGGSQPHNNMQPFLTLKCIIAVEGIFPSRN